MGDVEFKTGIEKLNEVNAELAKRKNPQAQSAEEPKPLSASAENERRRILQDDHWYASQDEVEAMSLPQYAKWREAGAHVKKEAPEVKVGPTAEEMVELENLPMAEYAKLRAQQEQEKARHPYGTEEKTNYETPEKK